VAFVERAEASQADRDRNELVELFVLAGGENKHALVEYDDRHRLTADGHLANRVFLIWKILSEYRKISHIHGGENKFKDGEGKIDLGAHLRHQGATSRSSSVNGNVAEQSSSGKRIILHLTIQITDD
jgi:hypothetical protein